MGNKLPNIGSEGNRDWSSFALLLIDVQVDFWNEVHQHHPDFPNKIRKLLNFCRSEGLEVIHIRASFKPDKRDTMPYYFLNLREQPCIEGTLGVQTKSFALENKDEKVFHKQTFDGFQNPELNVYLQAKEKRFILTAGLVTSVCVFLTTASAYQRGYLTAIVTDCCADKEENHRKIISLYEGLCFCTTTLKDIPKQYSIWRQQLDLLDAFSADSK